jgi:hypothetical protein
LLIQEPDQVSDVHIRASAGSRVILPAEYLAIPVERAVRDLGVLPAFHGTVARGMPWAVYVDNLYVVESAKFIEIKVVRNRTAALLAIWSMGVRLNPVQELVGRSDERQCVNNLVGSVVLGSRAARGTGGFVVCL